MLTLLGSFVILFAGGGARAAELRFDRSRTYRVETTRDPRETYAGLNLFLISNGLEDHETHPRMGSNFGDPNQLHVETSVANEPAVCRWCVDHGCALVATYAVDPPPAYSDPGVNRRFEEINDRLKALARAALEDPGAGREIAEFERWFEGERPTIPDEGGAVNLSREIRALGRATRNLAAPDLGKLAHPSLRQGPFEASADLVDPRLARLIGLANGRSQEDWARIAEAAPHLRNVIGSIQDELAHLRASSEDMRWLEARLEFLDQVVSQIYYPLHEKRMNTETYEVAAESFLRLLDALDLARGEGRVSEFEILDVLDRQLTLSARWILVLPPLGPRLERLFVRLAHREGLNPYLRLLFAAAVGRAPLASERDLYATLEGAVATRLAKGTPGVYLPVLPYGRLLNFVAGPTDESIHAGLGLVDRWMARHGVATSRWWQWPGPSIEVLRSRLGEARRAHVEELGLDACGSYLDRILAQAKPSET